MLKSYLKKIIDVASRGDAREESFYSALEKLLEDYKESVNKRKIQITTLPAKTEGGNQDRHHSDSISLCRSRVV